MKNEMAMAIVLMLAAIDIMLLSIAMALWRIVRQMEKDDTLVQLIK